MSHLINLGNNRQITWSEEEVIQRLKGIMKNKQSYWVRADLSICKSSRLTKLIWHYVVKHFSWMKKLFYRVDLRQSTAILSQIRAQVSRSDKLDLIHLFNRAIKKYNLISKKNSNHLEEIPIHSNLLKINILDGRHIRSSSDNIRNEDPVFNSFPAGEDVVKMESLPGGKFDKKSDIPDMAPDSLPKGNLAMLATPLKNLIFEYLDPKSWDAIAATNYNNYLAVKVHHSYQVAHLLRTLGTIGQLRPLTTHDISLRNYALWHLAILNNRMGLEYLSFLPVDVPRSLPLASKMKRVEVENDARVDPWSNIALLANQIDGKDWAKAYKFSTFIAEKPPYQLGHFKDFLYNAKRLASLSNPKKYIQLKMGNDLNQLVAYALSYDKETALELLRRIGYIQQRLGNHQLAQNAFDGLFRLGVSPYEATLEEIPIRQINANDLEGAKRSLNAHYALCQKWSNTHDIEKGAIFNTVRTITLNRIAKKYCMIAEYDQARKIVTQIHEELLIEFKKNSQDFIEPLIEHIKLFIKLYGPETAVCAFKEVLGTLTSALLQISIFPYINRSLAVELFELVFYFHSIINGPSKELKDLLIHFINFPHFLITDSDLNKMKALKERPENYRLILYTYYQIIVEENQLIVEENQPKEWGFSLKIHRLGFIAQCLRELGDYHYVQKILENTKALIKIKPYPPNRFPHIFIQAIHNQIDLGHIETARASLELMQEPPPSPHERETSYHFEMGLLHLRLKNVEQAKKHLTASFDINKREPAENTPEDTKLFLNAKRKELIEMGYRDQAAIAISAEIYFIFRNTAGITDRRYLNECLTLAEDLYRINFIDQAHAILKKYIKIYKGLDQRDQSYVHTYLQEIFIKQVELQDFEGAKELIILLETELGRSDSTMNTYHLFTKKMRFEGIFCLEKAYNLIGLHPRDHSQEYEPATETFQQRLANDPDKLMNEINQLPLISLKIMAWSGVVREQLKSNLNVAKDTLLSMENMAEGITHDGFKHEATIVTAELYMAMGNATKAEEIIRNLPVPHSISGITRIIEEAAKTKIITP